MANTEGSTFKRCGCRSADNKPLGAACPRLKRRNGTWSPSHGAWGYQVELPRTAEGRRRQARRTGLATQQEALEGADHVKDLLALAEDDEGSAVRIADAVQAALKARAPLPSLEEARRRFGAGVQTREVVPTVAAWLEEWLAAKVDLAAGTRRSYLGHVTNHLVPVIGHIRLDRLRVGHVQAVFDAIEERNDHIRRCRDSDDSEVRASVRGMRLISVATRHRIRATLRSALNEAISRPDLPIQVNAASHVKLPSCPRVRPVVWTPDRVQQYRATGEVPSAVMVWTPEQTAVFLRRARRDRLYAMFHLIAMKGLRRGEAVGLPWAQTRLGDRAIDVRFQSAQLGWEVVTSAPKSLAGQRTITLDAGTAQVLRVWRTKQNAERLAAGQDWCDTGLVFTHADGSALHPAWVTDLFHRIAAEAGLPPIGLHGLRHGAASLSLAAGVDVKVVSAELGHATTHFTQDTYQSVFPEVARAAAEATAALVPLQAGGRGKAG
jgi:integrase